MYFTSISYNNLLVRSCWSMYHASFGRGQDPFTTWKSTLFRSPRCVYENKSWRRASRILQGNYTSDSGRNTKKSYQILDIRTIQASFSSFTSNTSKYCKFSYYNDPFYSSYYIILNSLCLVFCFLASSVGWSCGRCDWSMCEYTVWVG